MNIRFIQEKDNAPMAAIIRKNLEAYQLDLPGTAYYDSELDRLYQFYQTVEQGNYWVLVDDEDQVIGGVGVSPLENQIAELQKLYLIDQEKSHGFGQKLLDHAIHFAKKNYQGLYIETSSILKKAKKLYEKNQFQALDNPLGATGHTLMDCWFLMAFKQEN